MKFLTLVAIVVALVVLVSAKSTKKDKVSDPSVTPKGTYSITIIALN